MQVKKHFNPVFSEKGTSLNNLSFYPEARSKHAKHRRCYSLFSKEKNTLDLSCRICFSKYNSRGLTVLPSVSLRATSDHLFSINVHLFSINVRFFIHAVSQKLYFQNKQNKEEDLTGLHKLGITIQTSKVNNSHSLNSYTMCNTKLSGTGCPLVGIHLLQVLEVIQQDSSH